jgi:hypothetical protein
LKTSCKAFADYVTDFKSFIVILNVNFSDTYTEVRSKVDINGTTVPAMSLPEVVVVNATLKLRGNNVFVPNVTSLQLYPRKLLYSFALSSQIIDVDILNVSYYLSTIYANYPGELHIELSSVVYLVVMIFRLEIKRRP